MFFKTLVRLSETCLIRFRIYSYSIVPIRSVNKRTISQPTARSAWYASLLFLFIGSHAAYIRYRESDSAYVRAMTTTQKNRVLRFLFPWVIGRFSDAMTCRNVFDLPFTTLLWLSWSRRDYRSWVRLLGAWAIGLESPRPCPTGVETRQCATGPRNLIASVGGV